MMTEQDKVTYELATLGGGCFWCLEGAFKGIVGVVNVVSGYTGGQKANPTYKEVCSGTTGHYEAVQITFDQAIISYEQLLKLYWSQIDPTDAGGQFFDRGLSYRTAIFYHDETQKEQALASRQALSDSDRFNKPIVTRILPAATFYQAEEYHQNYHDKQPEHYCQYRIGSGRDTFRKKYWG